jgi:FlaA1/EpsC-like NDP-sugar epimerase
MAEYGETFVLDMGQPVRIVDLVASYAAQLGVTDYEVEYTGLRPGEKLHEALVSVDEDCVETAHPRVRAARPRPIHADLGENMARLYSAAGQDDSDATRRILSHIIPEYLRRPSHVPAQAREVAGALAGRPSPVDAR